MILRPSLFAIAAALALASTPVVAAPPAKAKPPASKPAPGDPPVNYVVQRGDTLIGLGRSYLRKPGDYRRVQTANQISRPTSLPTGKTLIIDPNLLKTTPIDARLSAFSGQVEVETNGQRAPARAGMTIQEGQRIITGPGAFATFEMEDASRVTLPSNTAVRVERLRSVVMTNAPQRVFKLEQGRSTIQATPNPNPNGRFEVRTPVSISAVRGTEFRVGASADKAQTEVIKGGVGVGLGEIQPTGAPVPAGFGVTASPAGVSLPVALLPPPKLGDGGQNQGDKTVHFTVQPVPGATAYRLQLSRDAGFVDLFAEATQSQPAAEFGAVDNGTYFIRLTALDAGGLEGLPADYSFDRDLDVLEPGASPAAEQNGKHRNFLFRWSAAGDGVRTFRFQLFSGTEATNPIVDQPGLSEPQLTLTDLPPGAYSWRVAASRFKNGAITEKVGPLQSLQIGH
ncbi:FecR domain-containing protein [Caulobacter soli]|uniref:FecR domain-containing protein n=1 Tax=Caulobacter soli TaxID=2708539 RepID=UPI0013EB675B|nr:FecR domain-containing protein [Caulobacter soli]